MKVSMCLCCLTWY